MSNPLLGFPDDLFGWPVIPLMHTQLSLHIPQENVLPRLQEVLLNLAHARFLVSNALWNAEILLHVILHCSSKRDILRLQEVARPLLAFFIGYSIGLTLRIGIGVHAVAFLVP